MLGHIISQKLDSLFHHVQKQKSRIEIEMSNDAIFVDVSSFAAGKKSSDISQPFSSPLYLEFQIFMEIPCFFRNCYQLLMCLVSFPYTFTVCGVFLAFDIS